MNQNRTRLIGTSQVAARLGVDPKTVRTWAASGILPAVKIGKLWRFNADEIEQIVRSRFQGDR